MLTPGMTDFGTPRSLNHLGRASREHGELRDEWARADKLNESSAGNGEFVPLQSSRTYGGSAGGMRELDALVSAMRRTARRTPAAK